MFSRRYNIQGIQIWLLFSVNTKDRGMSFSGLLFDETKGGGVDVDSLFRFFSFLLNGTPCIVFHELISVRASHRYFFRQTSNSHVC